MRNNGHSDSHERRSTSRFDHLDKEKRQLQINIMKNIKKQNKGQVIQLNIYKCNITLFLKYLNK